MSIADIYLSLTDLYFTELRPVAAMESLQNLNEHNHNYFSLSEAHNGILHIANLASLASRSEERQSALCADYYQQALLRIMPRDYRAMAIAAFEQCGNLKGADLTPHEMLSCLNKIRHPIDEALRRSANRTDKNRDKHSSNGKTKIKKIVSPLPDLVNDIKTANKITKTTKSKQSRSLVAKNGSHKPEQKRISNKNIGQVTSPLCKLCGSNQHSAENCETYPLEERMVGKFPCRNCDKNLFHFTRFCRHKKDNPKN